MEEKIPQLTLTPDLGKEPVLEPVKEEDLIEKAEKAPEAGPDLSMLSQAEQQAVLTEDISSARGSLAYLEKCRQEAADEKLKLGPACCVAKQRKSSRNRSR